VALSRHAAFHTITLLAAGIYLIFMAVVGYFVRYMGGTWGGVLQISFLSASGLLLLVLLFSGQIRAKTRVWLSKNFFSYRYDYRLEWLRFTQTLAEGGDNTPAAVTRAMAQLCESPAGLLWCREESGRFVLVENQGTTAPQATVDLVELAAWLERNEWIIDLAEWRHSADIYSDLVLPEALASLEHAWLIIPLMFGNRAEGILLLNYSDLHPELNWEDRDLLKLAGRQAASHLAQYRASRALVESRQFEAFNRLSAYVVHDLKNILAQQSLIVSNAARFRDNPAFVDDVIDTVSNSVERMTRLMEQMRSGMRGGNAGRLDLAALLCEAVSGRASFDPEPHLKIEDNGLSVKADREQLVNVFSHIVQNAQEATGKAGRVVVRLRRRAHQAEVLVEDDGIGMDEEFIKQRLFKPFDSTKGLTGMGIGAYESREFVRALGGDILVRSEPRAGTTFSILLPCASDAADMDGSSEEVLSGQG
jgi:putative PEP-CTERM system histidine kinase